MEELSIEFRLETLGGGSYHPDLSFGRVWAQLEAFFGWAVLLRVSVFQQGVASSSLRVGTSYGLDLLLVLVFIVIQPLEARGILWDHFVEASIFLFRAIC